MDDANVLKDGFGDEGGDRILIAYKLYRIEIIEVDRVDQLLMI